MRSHRLGQYVAVGEERFLIDTQRQDAVIRRLEIIGEAAKRLSPELGVRYPTADWRPAAGKRDVLIHDDMGVDLSTVWDTVTKDSPRLKRRIEAILDDGGEPSS